MSTITPLTAWAFPKTRTAPFRSESSTELQNLFNHAARTQTTPTSTVSATPGYSQSPSPAEQREWIEFALRYGEIAAELAHTDTRFDLFKMLQLLHRHPEYTGRF